MSRDPYAIDRQPPPAPVRLSGLAAFFIVFGGPIAWFVQLCAGEMLTSWPCFPSMERLPEPIGGYEWTRVAAVLLLALCAVVAIAAGLLGLVTYRRVNHVEARCPEDPAWGRTCFLALWGTITGIGFAIATLVTLVAFIGLPRCAG
jgi:hypothetical protein